MRNQKRIKQEERSAESDGYKRRRPLQELIAGVKPKTVAHEVRRALVRPPPKKTVFRSAARATHAAGVTGCGVPKPGAESRAGARRLARTAC